MSLGAGIVLNLTGISHGYFMSLGNVSLSSLAGASSTFGPSSNTLRVTAGNVTGAATAGNTSTLTLNGSTGSASFGGVLRDNPAGNKLAVIKSGAGTEIFTNTNTFSGGFTLSGGVLGLSAGATLSAGNAATLAGGTLDLQGTTRGDLNLVLGSGAIQNGTLNMAAFLKNVSGTLGLSGVLNTSSLALNAGLVGITGNPALPPTLNLNFGGIGAPAANIVSSTAPLVLGEAAATLTGGGGLGLQGASSVLSSQSFPSALIADGTSGSASVTCRGLSGATQGPAFNVSAANTYITAGRVQVSNALGLGTGAGAAVYVDGNVDAQLFVGSTSTSYTLANPLFLIGAGFNEAATRRGVLRLDSGASTGVTLTGAITLLGDASIGNNSAITAAGSFLISSSIGTSNAAGATSFALTKVMTGVIKLTGTNSQSATNINAGALNINGDAAQGLSPGALTFTGGVTIGHGWLTLTNNSSGRAVVLRGDGDGIISGVISDTSTFQMPIARDLGAGSWTLSGANTCSGASMVTTGTLKVGNAKALGFGGISTATQATFTGTSNQGTTVASGATLDLTGTTALNEIITLNGTGNGGVGALINSDTLNPAQITGNLASATVTTPGLTSSATVLINGGTNVYSVAPTVAITAGNAAGTLTDPQLARISFYSDAGLTLLGGAALLSTGQLVPVAVPEASSWLLLSSSLLGLAALRRRTRA